MKKSVILSILALYIVAIFVVGFIGQKLRIYNPIIYVDNITCESDNFSTNVSAEDKSKGIIGIISIKEYEKGMKVQIKCKVSPDNATYPTLQYSMDQKICTYEVVDGIAILTFTDSGSVVVTVTSSDTQKKSVKIKVIVTDIGGIL